MVKLVANYSKLRNFNSFFDIIYRCAILPFFIQHKEKLEKLNEDISEMAKVSQIFQIILIPLLKTYIESFSPKINFSI